MNVKLISDSACDMTQYEAREQGVIVLPMKTIIDGEEYLDGVTASKPPPRYSDSQQEKVSCRL